MKLAAVALVLAACGPNHGSGRPCDESIAARAGGAYAAEDFRARERAYQTYRHSCQRTCYEGNDACFEYTLLNTGRAPSGVLIDEIPNMLSFCSQGRQIACDWVELNRATVDKWNVPIDDGPDLTNDGTPMGRTGVFIEQIADQNDWRIASDQTYSLDTGVVSFEVYNMYRGNTYQLWVFGNASTRFTAKLGGGGTDANIELTAEPVAADVFARSTTYQFAAGVPWLTIRDDGGDRGSVRVMLVQTD